MTQFIWNLQTEKGKFDTIVSNDKMARTFYLHSSYPNADVINECMEHKLLKQVSKHCNFTNAM